MEMIGIGDLHFDKLDDLIEDCNGKIIRSLKKVFRYARENGVRTIIQYGDVGDKSRLSDGAQCALYDLYMDKRYRDLDFHFVLGNHDFDENGVHSLRVLETITKHHQKNITVHTAGTEVELEGRKFYMMPHPFTDFRRDALNVGHLELAKSYRDNGRRVDHGVSTKHAAVLGHLHTCHKVRRAHYSGTLYQTNFGESLPKSFHHVKYEDEDPYNIEVINVPFEPPWKLLNLEVNSESDLSVITDDPDILYKIFIKEGLDIDLGDVLAQHPTIVRHNKFKSKEELVQLIQDDWDFETASFENRVDTREVLTEFFVKKSKLQPQEVKRAFKVLDRISKKASAK